MITDEPDVIPRDDRGRILKGRTLNPGGRPKTVKEIVDFARKRTPEAFEHIYQTMKDDGVDAKVRLRAAEVIIAYGVGTPKPLVEDDPVRNMSDEELLVALRAELKERDRAPVIQ